MAVYKIFPSFDNTIYSNYPNKNCGQDAILEIQNKNINGENQCSRVLIKFSQQEINDIIDNLVSGSNFEVFFKAYIAKAEGILSNSQLELYPISGSWINGNGTSYDSPITTNGSSWLYRNEDEGEQWTLTNYPSYTTGSYIIGNEGGGNWFTGSSDLNINLQSTQSFDYRYINDINVNITDIIKCWYSSSKEITNGTTNISNEGLIIKWEDSIEFNNSSSIQPSLNLYSIDTNTIYPPLLEIKWDNSIYNTGSLNQITDKELYLNISNNPGIFYPDSINKFRIHTRPEFPIRIYQTSSIQTNNYILPSESYYAIKELDTNEYVIDFDENYTKLSCDNEGNYFTLHMNGLEPERYFKILIKTIINGNTIIKDNNYYFKIIRG